MTFLCFLNVCGTNLKKCCESIPMDKDQVKIIYLKTSDFKKII